MAHSNFKRDYELGSKYEKLAPNHIDAFDEIKWAPQCQFFDYDFKVRRGDVWTSYEVKVDRRARITGNLYIEYKCNNLPSGIEKSKADFYIVFILNEKVENDYKVLVIPTEKLKTQCNKSRIGYCNKANDGRSEGYLVKINSLEMEDD